MVLCFPGACSKQMRKATICFIIWTCPSFRFSVFMHGTTGRSTERFSGNTHTHTHTHVYIFPENLSVECPVLPCIKTEKRKEGQVYIMKQIVAFRNCFEHIYIYIYIYIYTYTSCSITM